jgi:hypothetical protein
MTMREHDLYCCFPAKERIREVLDESVTTETKAICGKDRNQRAVCEMDSQKGSSTETIRS